MTKRLKSVKSLQKAMQTKNNKMIMKNYYTVEREAENEIVIDHSRFIAFCKEVKDEESARAFIEKIKKKHSLATHNCYAFVVEQGAISRFSDDGEPSGTAGMPILDAITSQNLVDTVVVVTRYFGGIKLGAGGLVRAYSKSCAEVLKVGQTCEYSFCSVAKLSLSYEQYNKISRLVSNGKRKVVGADYGEEVLVSVATTFDDYDFMIEQLNGALSGQLKVVEKEDKFMRQSGQ